MRTARESSTGENISHFTAIRMRVIGQGSLGMKLYSLDDIESTVLSSLTLESSTNRQPTRLANFMQQRASLELETTQINDYFRINRIIFFTKETFSSYPG